MNKLPELQGIHHVTAITSSAPKIYDFFTNVLGMRLVKKNVNQDDVTTYHLFFADDRGNAGTDMTFFDFKGISKQVQGTNDLTRTSFRVPTDASLLYWKKRFEHYKVKHEEISLLFGRKALFFSDFDDQRYALFSDENIPGVLPGEPWYKGPVPDEFAIYGLGPMFITVANFSYMKKVLEDVMKFRHVSEKDNLHLFEMGLGGNGATIIVEENAKLPQARQGYGGVHHVAFRVKDKQELDAWIDYFGALRLPNSGFVDRFYFKSLYVRLYPNILFEIATDGPGFIDDQEAYEILGETLTLPPHLRHRRTYIESVLKPFDTTRSNKVFKKEYLND